MKTLTLKHILRELHKLDPSGEYAAFMGYEYLRPRLAELRGEVPAGTAAHAAAVSYADKLSTLREAGIIAANDYFRAHGMDPINAEQMDCLTDPDRASEAIDMIDDWQARCGLPGPIAYRLTEWVVDSYYINARG